MENFTTLSSKRPEKMKSRGILVNTIKNEPIASFTEREASKKGKRMSMKSSYAKFFSIRVRR